MNNSLNRIVLLFAIGFLSFQAQSQSMKQRVADRLYDELSFFKAVELYEDLAKKEDANSYLKRRTAECYRFLGDSKNSEIWYEKLLYSTNNGADSTQVKSSTTEENVLVAEDYYYYAQMLKMNEKYDEANLIMGKFKSFSADNSVAKAHLASADYVANLKSNPERYTVAKMGKKVNTEHSDFGPNYFTVDGETSIVFASSRKNMAMRNEDSQWDGEHFLDVYISSIGEDGESKKVKGFAKEIKSKYHEGPVSFSNNGTQMYLTRSNYLNRKKGEDSVEHNNLKLYLSQKDSNGKWGELTEFPYNNDNYSLGHATVTEDGKIMYFSSDMPGGKGVTDIWKSTFVSGAWTTPTNVKSVNTEGREMFPFIAKNGVLYLSSDGHAGLGGLDLFRAPQSGSSFQTPINVGFPLNTNYDDFAMIINEDESAGYFSSNRVEGDEKKNDEIYRFKNNEPFTPPLCTVKGCAMEDGTDITLAGVTVNLINTSTNQIISTLVTDESGCYEFKDLEEGTYKLEGSLKKYITTYNHSFSTSDSELGLIEPANTLFKKSGCGLIGVIIDKQSNQPLANASITLLDNKTGEVKKITTDEKGEFTDDLANYDCPGGILDFELSIEKEGYLAKKVNFKKVITESGMITLEEDLGILAFNTEVSELCEISDLLYDFNKSNIRADAALELDKLVKCMSDNPEMIIEIGAHTDCRSSNKYNDKLSDARAKSARSYVISKGIAPYRIFGKGYGKRKLLVDCNCSDCSDEDHQKNRRTEFRVISGGVNIKNTSTDSF